MYLINFNISIQPVKFAGKFSVNKNLKVFSTTGVLNFFHGGFTNLFYFEFFGKGLSLQQIFICSHVCHFDPYTGNCFVFKLNGEFSMFLQIKIVRKKWIFWEILKQCPLSSIVYHRFDFMPELECSTGIMAKCD